MTGKKKQAMTALTVSVPADLLEKIDRYIEHGNYEGLRSREEVAVFFMEQGAEDEAGGPPTIFRG